MTFWISLSAYLSVVFIFIALGLAIYKEMKEATPKERAKKQAQYIAILIGGAVVFTLLVTVFDEPVKNLRARIENYTQTVIWGQPEIKRFNPDKSITINELANAKKAAEEGDLK